MATTMTFEGATGPSTLQERLEQAGRLGYLKCDWPRGPLFDAYCRWCESTGRARVVLFPHRAKLHRLSYRLPVDRELRDDACDRLAALAADCQAQRPGERLTTNTMVWSQIGEIEGLRPDVSEGFAFRVAETANDLGQTVDLSGRWEVIHPVALERPSGGEPQLGSQREPGGDEA